MPEGSRAPELVEMTDQECIDLLGQGSIGRIGLSIGALPVVLPVNYCLFERDILVRTVPGTKLQAATAGSIVAFEVDSYEPDGSRGWSVLVQGEARQVEDRATLERLQSLPLQAWALNGTADRYVLIHTEIVTGRRFGPGASEADGTEAP